MYFTNLFLSALSSVFVKRHGRLTHAPVCPAHFSKSCFKTSCGVSAPVINLGLFLHYIAIFFLEVFSERKQGWGLSLSRQRLKQAMAVS
jgi:hypothetical protein